MLKLEFVLPIHKDLPVAGASFETLCVNSSLHVGHSVSTGVWPHFGPGIKL